MCAMGYFAKPLHLMVTLLLMLVLAEGMGQNQEPPTSRHRAGAGLGITFIPVARHLHETDARGLFVPSLRLDYFYHFFPRWAVGFMGNYELGHYMIVDQEIEREHALGLTLMGKFDITGHLGVFAGGGAEIEVHRNLVLIRLGAEYSIDLKKNWVLIPKLSYDFKQNYNTWSFSLTMAKKF